MFIILHIVGHKQVMVIYIYFCMANGFSAVLMYNCKIWMLYPNEFRTTDLGLINYCKCVAQEPVITFYSV